MPIYQYQCKRCNKLIDEYRKMCDNKKDGVCPFCNSETRFVFTAPHNFTRLYPYMDQYIAEKPVEIKSRSHYQQELKKRGLREKERGGGGKGQWV